MTATNSTAASPIRTIGYQEGKLGISFVTELALKTWNTAPNKESTNNTVKYQGLFN